MKKLAALAVAGAVSFGTGACGSDDGGAAKPAASAAATSTTKAALGDVKADLAKAFAGTDRALPASGPKAAGAKSIWILSCAQSAPGCAIPAAGAEEAAKAIGWKAKVVDGKFDPSVYNQQVRAAIAAKADGLVLVFVDCPAVSGSLKAARTAGMKVYGLGSVDCDDQYAGGKAKQLDGALTYDHGRDYADFLAADFAAAISAFITADDPKAKVIALKQEDAIAIHHLGDGFDEALKAKCPDCEVYPKSFTGADLIGNKLQAITAAMLTQHPDATTVMAPYDATILLGVGAAVEQARRGGRKLVLTGGEGLPPNVQLIKAGQQDMAVGVPGRWEGWASVDGLNRVFADAPQVDAGIGFQLMTKDKELPTGAVGYDGNAKSAGYDENYRRIWAGK